MKHLYLISTLLFLSANVSAERNKDFLDYGSKDKNKAYEKLLSTIPFASDLPKELKKPRSLTYQYYTKNGEYFNHVPLKYFVENTEKLKGVYSTFILTPNITELDKKYNLLKVTNNPITRNNVEKDIYDLYQKNTKNYNLEFLRKYDYYSEIAIKGAISFNFDEKKQELVLDSRNNKTVNLYFYCDQYGGKFAYVYADSMKVENKFTIDSYVQNTPIFLEISEEIKANLTYFKNIKNEKTCKYTKRFSDMDFAEKYINSVSNPKDKLLATFTLNKTQPNRSYLVGKLKHIVLTKYDYSDGYVKPIDVTPSLNFNDIIDVPMYFADKYINSHIKNNSFNSDFKNIINSDKHTYSLNNDDLYFKFKSSKEALVFSNRNRFYASYSVTYDSKEIILTLNKIKREFKQNFPNKVRILYVKDIIKQKENKSEDIIKEYKKHTIFVLKNNDIEYKEHELNFKHGFLINMEEIEKIK